MAPHSPAISVIIPHLNQHEALRHCLASLAKQSFDAGKIEIIVVDNGSRQSPAEFCSAFNRVRLFEEPEPGPGPARNKGVAQARGPILAFIDADCTADENWLITVAGVFAKDNSTQIIGGDVRIAVINPARLNMLEAYESIYAYRQKDYIERQGFSGTGNLAMRREAYEAVGPFAGIDVAEDRQWGQRAAAMGFRLDYVPGMIVYHPARRTFAELCAKWDRQVAHDFAEKAGGGALGRLRWFGLTMAVAGSPVVELGRIVGSSRVNSWQARLMATFVMIRIRLYRAFRMTGLLVNGRRAARSRAWNRE